jgi:hypothetical protein
MSEEDLRQQFQIPNGAPVAPIAAYLSVCQHKKGDNKESQQLSEQKKAAETIIIQWMKENNYTYVQVAGRWLVLQTKRKPVPYSTELLAIAYQAFHQQNLHTGPIKQAAERFVQFCEQKRTQCGDVVESLCLKKTRPLAHMIQQMSGQL